MQCHLHETNVGTAQQQWRKPPSSCLDRPKATEPDTPEHQRLVQLWAPRRGQEVCRKRITQSIRIHGLVRGMNSPSSPFATRSLRAALAADDGAVTADPSCSLAWLQRGKTQVLLRRFTQAVTSFEKVVALEGDGSRKAECGGEEGPPDGTELEVAKHWLEKLSGDEGLVEAHHRALAKRTSGAAAEQKRRVARSAKRDEIPHSVAAWDAQQPVEPTQRRAFSGGVNDRANDGFKLGAREKGALGSHAHNLHSSRRIRPKNKAPHGRTKPQGKGKGKGRGNGKGKGKGRRSTGIAAKYDDPGIHHRTEAEAEADERRILERQKREDSVAEAEEADFMAEFATAATKTRERKERYTGQQQQHRQERERGKEDFIPSTEHDTPQVMTPTEVAIARGRASAHVMDDEHGGESSSLTEGLPGDE